MGWEEAGAAWGAKAWDWALYQEPFHAASYDVALQRHNVGAGIDYLDVACGSGLCLSRAVGRGANVSGLDASAELLAVAAQRLPNADLHQGDMANMPFGDASFDVVTSFNGVQYGAADTVREIARVLRPGGAFELVVWGDRGDHAAQFKVIGDLSAPAPAGAPGPMAFDDVSVADLLEQAGIEYVGHDEVLCIGLYRNLDDACQGMAASGPAQGAIAHSGEQAFDNALREVLSQFVDPRTGRVRMSATFRHFFGVKK